jgi:hypothetical protein
MTNKVNLRWVLACALMAVGIPQPAKADSFSITPLKPQVKVTEGEEHSIIFYVTADNPENTYTIFSIGDPMKEALGPDKTDDLTSVTLFKSPRSCVVGSTIGVKGCYIIVNFTTGPPDKGPRFDGMNLVTEGMSLVHDLHVINAKGQAHVTVSDVPEPSTLLLMASGLVSMAGVIRIKLRS